MSARGYTEQDRETEQDPVRLVAAAPDGSIETGEKAHPDLMWRQNDVTSVLPYSWIEVHPKI